MVHAAEGNLGLLAGCDLHFDGVGRQLGTLLVLWKAMWDFAHGIYHRSTS